MSFGPAWFSFADASQVILAILPVWLFGALTGYLLPRPFKKAQSATTWLVLSNSHLRWFAALYHLLVIVRDVWNTCTRPGTFRAFCKGVLSWAQGKGFVFDLPACAAGENIPDLGSSQTTRDSDNWYVTNKDLAFFQYHMEQNGECKGASAWELMMDKDIPNVIRYTAWRRTLPNGKTEYKSSTISPDATATEHTDMYFDDNFRPKWDTMIIHHEVLEHGDFAQRQQVVRWIRRFPFKFLSDREYTIARRMMKVGDAMYGLTKAVDHPRTRPDSPLVKMEVYYSMWRSRTIECPWGSGKPATETVLLHHEQFKIPENLARFAVRHGMWGFVKTVSERTPEFIAMRRSRGIASNDADAQAYGSGCCPNPPMQRAETSMSALSLDSMDSSSVSGGDYNLYSRQGTSVGGAGGRPQPKGLHRKMSRMLAVVAAGGLAVLLNRSSSMPNLAGMAGNGVASGSVKVMNKRRQQSKLRRNNSMAL